MTKNTHLAVGVAVTTMVLMPKELSSMAMCICGSAIGSVISDVDVSSSKPRKTLNKLISFSITAIAILVMLELVLKMPIYNMIESQTNAYRILLGYVTFLLLSIYGTTTKHRTYTHSIIGLISFTGVVWIAMPPLAIPFGIGMVSHIMLDMLNTKKVRLLYPMKNGGIALKLCLADGKANKVIGITGTLIVVAELILFIVQKVHVIH